MTARPTRHTLRCGSLAAGSEVHLIEHRMEDGTPSPFPLLRCRNVLVLPGIPSLLQVTLLLAGPACSCLAGTWLLQAVPGSLELGACRVLCCHDHCF